MLSICRPLIYLIIMQCCFELASSSHSNNFGDTKFKSRFATKTTYNAREPDDIDTLTWTTVNIPSHLKPVLIDATLRHGTRYPSDKRVKEWKKIVLKFQESARSSSHPLFTNAEFRKSILDWESKFPAENSYRLSKLGWEEHVSLGVKYFSMMPDLWRMVLHDGNLLVLSSSKVRSMASSIAFLNALQHVEEYGAVDYDHADVSYREEKVMLKEDKMDTRCGNVSIHVADDLLRFFDRCEKYVKTVEKNESAEFEFENYFKSKTMEEIFKEIPDIENKDFYYVYQQCAFEHALFNDSTWCHLFSESHIEALEYASDLKHYYKNGKGYAVNYEQSCILLQNISKRINENISKRSDGNLPVKVSATLRFGHAETLIPLISLLGFYQNDGHLKADNFDDHRNRVFRTGKISPFSGNMAIILYESSQDKGVFISFVINEYFMKPFGLDCFFCDFGPNSKIRKIMQEKLQGCNQVCNLNHNRVSDEL